MNRILLDTNVVLDARLERDPWVAEARTIWSNHLQYRSYRRSYHGFLFDRYLLCEPPTG
jgi:hypothetical protein